MARTGIFSGVNFDAEIFGGYMQEQSCLNPAFVTSGVLLEDPILRKNLANSGNVGTTPFFLPVDGERDALNYDGKTDNTPTELTNGKQTYMAISRMKAWKETTFVRYLSGKSPLQNLANNLVVPYWTNQWNKDVIAIIKGVMGVAGMASHKTDISVSSGSITETNKITLTTPMETAQKALGDKRRDFSLFICHSTVATRLAKLNITEVKKFTIPNTMEEIELKVIGNMVVFESDEGTVDTSVSDFPRYHSYLLGRGALLTSPKEVDNPYGTKYDHEKNGGVEKLYTKQARVIHPNGFSLKVDEIDEESPTRTELANSANWELKFDHKNIAIAEIISNG